MNWKQFKKRLLEQHRNLCFIDRQKCKRGLNEVRILRFFFCGNFKPYVEKYNSIGFLFVVERNHFDKSWTIDGYSIDKDTQKNTQTYFRYSDDRAEGVYIKAFEKISEMMKL